MPTVTDLGRRVKQKYPGAYDDIDDTELGRKIKTKFPGDYDDFSEDLTQAEAGAELDRLSAGPKPFTPPRRIPPMFPAAPLDIAESRPAPIPGTEKLGGAPPPIAAPPPPPDPFPLTKKVDREPGWRYGKGGEETVATGNELLRLGLDASAGAEQIVKGVKGVLDPTIIEKEREARGITSPIYGFGASWLGRRKEALSDILEGSAGVMEPTLVPAAIAAPLPTAAVVGGATLFGAGARKGAEAMGADPETARLAGNVGGAVGAVAGGGGAVRGMRALGGLLNARSMPPKPQATPPIGESPTPAPAPSSEAPPLEAPPPPMGMSARMRQEHQLGPVAEIMPQWQTPLQRATREQLGDVYAALVPSGIVGDQVQASRGQLARLRPVSGPPPRVNVPLPQERLAQPVEPAAPEPAPQPVPETPATPTPRPPGPAFTTEWAGEPPATPETVPPLQPPAPPKTRRAKAGQRGSLPASALLPELSPEDREGLTTFGRDLIQRGAFRQPEWQRQMVEAFGDWVQPHLDTVWDAAQRGANRSFSRKGRNEPGLLIQPSGQVIEMEDAARHFNMVTDLPGQMRRGAVRVRGNGIEVHSLDAVSPQALQTAARRVAARYPDVYLETATGTQVYDSAALAQNRYDLLSVRPERRISSGERGSLPAEALLPEERTDAVVPTSGSFGFISPTGEVLARQIQVAIPISGRRILPGGHPGLASKLGMPDEFVAQQRGYTRFRFANDGTLDLSFVDNPRARARTAEVLADLPEQPSTIHVDLLTRAARDKASLTFFSVPEALRYLRSSSERGSLPAQVLLPSENPERKKTLLPAGEQRETTGLIPQILDTHEASGGSTYNLQSGENLAGKRYYSVSPYKNLEEVIDGDLTPQALDAYIRRPEIAAKLNDPSGDYSLGTWKETSTGKTYLDVVVTVPDRARAMQIGADNAQKAIFDLHKFEEIPVEAEQPAAKPGWQDPVQNEQQVSYNVKRDDYDSVPLYGLISPTGSQYTGRLHYDIASALGFPSPEAALEAGFIRVANHERGRATRNSIYEFVDSPEARQRVTESLRYLPDERFVTINAWDKGPNGWTKSINKEYLNARDAIRGLSREDAGGPQTFLNEVLPENFFGEAQAARSRVKGKFGSERGSMPANIDDIKDMGVWGAAYLARGVMGKQWERQMVRDFGPAVKPNLERIMKRSVWNLDRFVDKVGEQLLPNTKRLLNLYKDGKSGEMFYEKSTEEIRRTFGDDSDLFLRFVAATSPMNSIEGNLSLAVKAYLSYKATGGIERGLFTRTMQTHLERIISGEKDWTKVAPGGPKEGSFGENLTGDLDRVTVDRWIARAFGWPETFSTNPYKFMDYAITQVARKIGVEPAHVQAGIWKAAKEANIEAGGAEWTPDDFGQAIRRRIADQDPEMLQALEQVPKPSGRATFQEPVREPEFAGAGERGSITLSALTGISTKASEASAEFQRTILDRFSDIRALTESARLPRDIDPYISARLYAGRGGKIINRLNDLGKILRPARKAGLLDDMKQLALFERYEELANRGITEFPGGQTLPQIQADKAALEARLGPAKLAQVHGYIDQYRNFMDGILTEMKDAGVISQAGYDAIKANNQAYIPLERAEYVEKNLDHLPIGSEVFSVPAQQVIKCIEGSTKQIVDPIESSIKRIYRAVSLIGRNKVATDLANLSGRPEFSSTIIPLSRRNPVPPSGMDKFSVLRDGRKYEYAAPQPVVDAIKSLRREEADLVTKMASRSGSWLRAGATSLNVAFIPPNAFRDFQTATLVSEVGFNPLDWVRGFAEAFRKGPDYQRYLESGAAFSGFFEGYRSMPRVSADVTGQMTLHKAVSFVDPFELIRWAGEKIEMAPRLGVFKRGLRKGLGETEAAFASRNATVDFSKAGHAMRVINQWVPFLNARTQGMVNVFGAVKGKPGKSALILGAMLGIPIISAYLHNTREHADIWNNIAQFEKDNNFIIIYGDEVDEDGNPTQVIKIPKGDQGKVFGNPLENFLAYLDNNNPKAIRQLALQVGSDISPINFEREGKFSTSSVLSSALPPAAKAGVEWATNKNLYTGRDIVPQSMEKASPEQQYKWNTSPAMVALGKFLGVSPLLLQNTAGTMFGGLGRQLTDIGTAPRQVTRRFAGAYGKAEQNQQFERLRQFEQAATDIDVNDQRNSQALFERVRKAPPAQRRQLIIDRIANGMTDGEADRFMDLLQQKAEGTTPIERALQRAPIEVRAKSMLDELKRREPTARQKLFNDWAEKGLFTDAVAKEMAALVPAR